jgi:transposase
MPWSEITRRQYRRDGLRYASDVTDEEWQLIAPHLPPAKPLGRRRATDLCPAVNAMLYLLTTGCRWRLLPEQFPPYTTVQRFFYGWRDDGTWRRINHHLLLAARQAAGQLPRAPAHELKPHGPAASTRPIAAEIRQP